jgi:hypothetical protein
LEDIDADDSDNVFRLTGVEGNEKFEDSDEAVNSGELHARRLQKERRTYTARMKSDT